MATKLDNRSEEKPNDRIQEHYDQQFNQLTSPEHMAKDGDEQNLSEKENNPDDFEYDSQKIADEELPSQDNFDYSAEPKKKRLKLRGRRKQLALGAGIFGIVAGVISALFVFLPTLKVTHILNNLEGRFYGVAINAVERRAETLLSRYMRGTVFPSVKLCGRVVNDGCFDYSPGKGVAANLYRNWSNARIEEKLFNEHGIKIEWRGNNDYSLTTRGGANIIVDGTNFEFSDLRTRSDVGAREIRRELKKALDGETFWKKLMLRHSVRKLASKKYNIRWCVFACDARDDVRDFKVSALQKLKLKIIERTIGPFSDRLGLYLTCAVSDCTNREFISARSRVINRAVEELGEETVERIISETSDRRLAQVLVDKIVSKVFGTAAGKGAAAAVPVVGWVYAVDALNQIDIQLYNGAISQFLADNTASQYAEFYLTYKSHYDEAIDGQLTLDEVGAQNQLLNGIETSLVYQRDLGSGASNSIGFNIFTPVSAQSSSDEYLCADDQPIPAGELVCEERKVGKLSDYDSWRQSDAAIRTSGIVLGGYRCGVFQGIEIADGGFCKPGSTADKVWFLDGVIHEIFSVFNDIISFIGSAIVNLVPQVVLDAFAKVISVVTQFLLERAFVFLQAGVGPGRQVFDDLYAGADVVGNEFAKGFEDPLTGEFVGLGGKKLTDQEIEDNLSLYQQNQAEEFQSLPLFARMFSPSQSKSLLSTIAMSIPTPSGLNGTFHSLAGWLSPLNLIANAGATTLNPVYAQQQYDGDPFAIHQYGYAVDDDMFNLDPDEITPESCSPGGDIYEAWLDGIQEETFEGQVVHEVANPCMLEYVATNILGCWFTTSDDCGVENNNVVNAPGENGGVSGGISPVEGLTSHPDLGPALANGYYRMPEAPNNEYAFWGATPSIERCGSRALVDLIYTISVKWSQKYPSDKILVGDLNAVGGLGHMNGVDWDIWLQSSIANGSFGTNQKAKELGRLLADTGIVKDIFYNVVDVQNDFNTYAQQNGLSGTMSFVDGHFDHMQLRINDEYRGAASTRCDSTLTTLGSSMVLARTEDTWST